MVSTMASAIRWLKGRSETQAPKKEAPKGLLLLAGPSLAAASVTLSTEQPHGSATDAHRDGAGIQPHAVSRPSSAAEGGDARRALRHTFCVSGARQPGFPIVYARCSLSCICPTTIVPTSYTGRTVLRGGVWLVGARAAQQAGPKVSSSVNDANLRQCPARGCMVVGQWQRVPRSPFLPRRDTHRAPSAWTLLPHSPGFIRLTGWSSDMLIGQSCGLLLQGPASSATTVKSMGRALGRGSGLSCRILNYRRDGAPFWSQVRPRSPSSARATTRPCPCQQSAFDAGVFETAGARR